MDTEWQTLLKNQAAKVLSPEETAPARERWPGRAVDTRWDRIWLEARQQHAIWTPGQGTTHHEGFHRS